MSDAETSEHLRLLRQQTTLAKFGELALKSDDLNEILPEACSLVREALGTDLAKVMELQDDGETLLVRAGVGWKPGVVGVVTVKAADDTSEGHALKTGEPMISPNIETETRFRYPAFLIDNGVKAIANVPIVGGQKRRPFGILQIDSRTPRQFNDDDTAFLRSYANLIAAAVDRLRMIKDVRTAEAQLRESKNLQEAALETGVISFFEWDISASTIMADRHFACFCGLDPETVADGVAIDAVFGMIHPEDHAAVKASIAGALASLSDFAEEFRFLHADGEVRWVHLRGHCYENKGGNPLRYTGTAVEITASKATEEALRRSNEVLAARMQAQQAHHAQQESEARFRFATQAGRFGVWELDLGNGNLTTSAMCKDNFGRNRDTLFTYAELREAVQPSDRGRMRAAIRHSIATGAECDIECGVERSDGTAVRVQLYAQILPGAPGTAGRMAGISLDITERVRAEERISQSQRIEAVGRLTAGVAHDFNNVLQALLGGLELAIADLPDRPDVRANLEVALQAGERGARLTSHLLSFARQQVLRPAALDLPPFLKGLSLTLERTLGHDVTIHIEVAPDLPHVLADAAHLDSALLNLALNARDAMREGGELWIAAYAANNGQVVIPVTDTGEGMTPEALAHACEPFFSTKGMNGSGLGLSMVQGFARQSGGELRIQSTLGQGTRIENGCPWCHALLCPSPRPCRKSCTGRGGSWLSMTMWM